MQSIMTATLDDLPFEILSTIFAVVHRSNPFHNSKSKINKTPFLLGCVCSRWRQVSIATPQLWTQIWVECTEEFDRFDLTSARAFLSYSGASLPLSLHVYRANIDPRFGETGDAFDKLVTSQATRWTNVNAELFIQPDGVKSLAGVMRGFTTLTTLTFSSSPSTLPWRGDFGVSSYNALWSSCRRSGFEPATLPSLLHLTLNFEHYAFPLSAVPILELLTLPSLSSFTMVKHPSVYEWFCDACWRRFAALLVRSGYPPLKAIHTNYSDRWDRTAWTVLLRSASLEEVNGFYFPCTIWWALAPNVGTGAQEYTFEYAPNLKSVWIGEIPAGRVNFLVQILLSRWRGGAGSLKEVRVLDGQPYLDKFLNEVRNHWELEGLKITVGQRETTCAD